MLRQYIFRKNQTLYFGFKRYFLSNNFKLTNEWKNEPVLSLYNEVSSKKSFENKTKNVHVLESINQLEKEILHLRLSEFATSVMEATNHAVIRKLIDSGSFQLLLHMLDNILDYGIKLDDYTACYFLNELIRMKEFKLATQISTKHVLQLYSNNGLAEALSIYVIYMYLRSDMISQLATLEKDSVSNADNIDRKSFGNIIGSTLTKLSYSTNNNIRPNLQILGLIMCRNHEHALTLLHGNPEIFYKDILQFCLDYALADEHINLEMTALIENLIASEKIMHNSFISNLHLYVDEIAIKMEPVLIERQIVIYKKWLDVVKSKLNENSLRDKIKLRLGSVKESVQHMDLTEKQMWFFHKEEVTNLEIESMKQIYPKKWFGKRKKPQQFDDEYIPPVI